MKCLVPLFRISELMYACDQRVDPKKRVRTSVFINKG